MPCGKASKATRGKASHRPGRCAAAPRCSSLTGGSQHGAGSQHGRGASTAQGPTRPACQALYNAQRQRELVDPVKATAPCAKGRQRGSQQHTRGPDKSAATAARDLARCEAAQTLRVRRSCNGACQRSRTGCYPVGAQWLGARARKFAPSREAPAQVSNCPRLAALATTAPTLVPGPLLC